MADEHAQPDKAHRSGSQAAEGMDRAQPFPVIQSKIQPPNRAPETLTRNRLVNLVHSHLDRKLIILSAPAGYGKTSLLVDFISETELAVCWLTLDAYDRDLRLFLENFIASISARFPKFGQESRRYFEYTNDPASNLIGIVAAIVRDIQASINEYFVLILDDYHSVEGQDSIAEFLELFITYVDENCHLILSSRNLVALPNLVLLISRRMAAGLSIDELRFTAREIQNLAQRNYRLELELDEADRLVQRTAGWITGILLTADPHWKIGDTKMPQRGYINQEIYEFLTTQLLDQQPEDLRQFLLQTSILDEITSSLCKSILGITDAEAKMQQVRERNLFVAQYNLTGGMLRYNDLFREFLRTRFKTINPQEYSQLSLKVAEFHASRHEWDRAIERYQELDMPSKIVTTLERMGGEYFDRGRWDSLIHWLDVLDKDLIEQKPLLLILRGKIHAERGQHNQALEYFGKAEKIFLFSDSTSDLARILVLQGSVLRLQDLFTDCISHCQHALVLLDTSASDDQQSRAMAHKNLGLCWMWLGEKERGIGELHKALEYFTNLGSVQDIGMVHHDLGLSAELSGDLTAAARQYRTALTCWEQQDNPSPWANELNSLAVVDHLRGRLDLALTSLNQALEKSRQAGDLRIQSFALGSLGDVYRDLHDIPAARNAYQEALDIAHRTRSRMMITYALDGLGNLARMQGDWIQAMDYLNDAWQRASQNNSSYELCFCAISLGSLANERGQLTRAAEHLDEAICIAEQARLPQYLSRALLNRAQTAFLAGESGQAWDFIHQALDITVELGYHQHLVFDSSRLLNLLQSFRVKAGDSGLLSELIETALKFQETGSAPTLELPAAPLPELKIVSFGNPVITVDGREVHWEIAKSRDLFFLILQTPQGLTRDQIGAVFWPDHNPERLEPAFRSTIYRLRRALYRESVLFLDGLYRFNWSGTFWFDRLEFEELVDRSESGEDGDEMIAHLERALSLYQGDYLQDNYDDWCVLERERLRVRRRFALGKLADLYSQYKLFPKALHMYRTLIREDPYNEDTQRELIRCLAGSGDRAAAINHYQSLVRMLWEELGLRPDPRTDALYWEIID